MKKHDFTLVYNVGDALEDIYSDDFDLKDFQNWFRCFRAMSGPRYIVRNSDNVVLIESEMSQVHD